MLAYQLCNVSTEYFLSVVILLNMNDIKFSVIAINDCDDQFNGFITLPETKHKRQ